MAPAADHHGRPCWPTRGGVWEAWHRRRRRRGRYPTPVGHADGRPRHGRRARAAGQRSPGGWLALVCRWRRPAAFLYPPMSSVGGGVSLQPLCSVGCPSRSARHCGATVARGGQLAAGRPAATPSRADPHRGGWWRTATARGGAGGRRPTAKVGCRRRGVRGRAPAKTAARGCRRARHGVGGVAAASTQPLAPASRQGGGPPRLVYA